MNTYIHVLVCTCVHEYTLKPYMIMNVSLLCFILLGKYSCNTSPHTMKDATGVPPERPRIYVSRAWRKCKVLQREGTPRSDIQDLVGKNILVEDIPGAKRPSYSIVFDAEDLTQFFTDVRITQENGIPYLNAMFKGHRNVRERILPLDAERYLRGDLPLSNMLNRYCSYLMVSN